MQKNSAKPHTPHTPPMGGPFLYSREPAQRCVGGMRRSPRLLKAVFGVSDEIQGRTLKKLPLRSDLVFRARSRIDPGFPSQPLISSPTLAINFTPMRSVYQLHRLRINEAKKHAPVSGDAKRKHAEERSREMRGVQAPVVGILLQENNQFRQLALLRTGEFADAFGERRVVGNLNHFERVLQGKIFCLRSVETDAVLRRAVPCAQTPGDIRLPGRGQQWRRQMNATFLPHVPRTQYSYD